MDWCCFHRFDARPVFARLLDWDRGGYFRIAPVGPYATRRRYLPGTHVLETRFMTRSGVLVLTDALAMRSDAGPGGEASPHPYHQLIRRLHCPEGQLRVSIEFNPRFDYGLTYPRLEMRGDHLASVSGGADALLLQTGRLPIAQTDLCGCGAETELKAGQEAWAVLTYALPHELRAEALTPEEVVRRLETTRRYWEVWSGRCTYQGPYRQAVLRSALVLKGLSNAPTGAIVAAATTSLPEEIGGVRNWDYRYTWLRDAALNLYALFSLGYTEEARAFMAWLERTTAGRAEDVQVLYGVGGERFLPEVEIHQLEGYRGSRPVRIGNRAATQFQLDTCGELLDTAWLYHRHGGVIRNSFWDFLRGVVEAVARSWQEPDEGIWEVRGAPRHFVLSKVMTWVAVDRGIRLAGRLGLPADLPRWRHLRRDIRRRVEEEGVDPQTGAFIQAFGSRELDASTLLIPLVRFLPVHDPRVRATVERVARELSVDGLVHRYLGPDGLPGEEGAFLICSFWLVDGLALVGELGRARALFERLLGTMNDVGLLAEEVDPRTGELLGNFPQAFSHVGLVGAALNLQRAARRQAGASGGGAAWPGG